ncbi:hypothetical protein ALI144C_48655 [Actinosynnema sp. ALI-1.44]|uniref:DEAD/DEAH box helicase n=1 Tax=Actinosynnema sp. ALI-1.44 TaxID=1933779 RepID=UPI00097C7F17|nr:AAA domain-containing protein [Actinosynnema sp. ALI-1.44]ONI70518.1 hypothetical protein ALI144C_48655 [Actinosynnema sp. ALI-1.44]
MYTVHLPGWIVLASSGKLELQLNRLARGNPGLPGGTGQIMHDLTARPDGVPVVLREPQSRQRDWSIGLHLGSYVVWGYVTNRGDGYLIGHVSPLRLSDHDRLARGCLLVKAGWHVVREIREIPPKSQSRWPELRTHWDRLKVGQGDQRAAPALSAHHTAYLDTLGGLVDATQRIQEQQRISAPTYPYRLVTSASERRHSSSPIYVFEVVGAAVPDRGVFVQLRGKPEQRGQVTRVHDKQVTVRFDEPVDWDHLEQQGQLEQTSSNIVYDKQREAIAAIRNREARNQSLLATLVDHKVRPIEPADDLPAEKLDEDQQVAFQRALGVQDMMVVLGPPGTGKTRTISEIARSYALAHGRGPILIASHTNRAVDNVLAKLPREVTVVRIGNEGKIGPEGKPFLLERQAVDLRKEITSSTRAALRKYQNLDLATRWADELGRRLDALSAAEVEQQAAHGELTRLRRAFGGSAQSAVDEADTTVRKYEHDQDRRHGRLQRLGRRRARSATRASLPVLGPLFRAVTRSRDKRILSCQAEIARTEPRLAAARRHRRDAEAALHQATVHVPEVQNALHVMETIQRRVAENRSAAVTAAGNCRTTMATMDTVPETEDLPRLRTWLDDRIPLLTTREKLLRDWHDTVSESVQQLYPELIRYADVIGATCIGAASRQEIAGVDFDIAIVDEAGQIGVTDVLVPLVRAKRAVLVGDHRQLPPFVDRELKVQAGSFGAPVRDLLTKSALEMLLEFLPDSHVKQLNQQRRMPEVIARFISDAFYDGELRTMVRRTHDDPLFTSPLAFVDTTHLPSQERSERKSHAGNGGIENPAEARLLSRLAADYDRRGAEWALIVPYTAQVTLIKDSLRALSVDGDVIEANVGTVDSFQGGERDVILYGFTRSNRGNKVGFLDELRRANVAFTRTKSQLVLVGDMGMLLRATDSDFRELITALRDHIREHGDVRRYRDLMSTLTKRGMNP